MKKIFIISILIITFIFPIWTFAAESNSWNNCNIKTESFEWDNAMKVWDALDNCLSDSNLVNWKDAIIESWLMDLINWWVKNIWVVLWILAVGSIVYWSLLMTLSAWEDEKVKKSKDIIKWWIFGFLWVIFASSIILLIVNIMYSLEV